MKYVARAVVWVAVVALAAAAGGVWTAFGRTLARAKPLPVASIPAPNAVAWHHRVFQSRQALARELAREGVRYEVWAADHPHAASLLASRSH